MHKEENLWKAFMIFSIKSFPPLWLKMAMLVDVSNTLVHRTDRNEVSSWVVLIHSTVFTCFCDPEHHHRSAHFSFWPLHCSHAKNVIFSYNIIYR